MRNLKQLGKKEWVIEQIMTTNSELPEEDLIIDFEENPESWINTVFDVSRDEMSEKELELVNEWILDYIKHN